MASGLKIRWLEPHIIATILFTHGIMNAAGPLRTLTTAREAHSLTLEEAARAYPIRLRAVVTYYDPYIDSRHVALFVHDSTGAIFVSVPTQPATPIAPGALVEVTGVSAGGDFAPIVDKSSVRVVGKSHVPVEVGEVSLAQLLTGAYDGQWVETEGVVHSVSESGRNVNLEISMNDGSLTATTLKQQDFDYFRLVNAKIKIHANAAPVFNRNRQMTGVRLFFPNAAAVRVEEAPIDPYDLQALSADLLLRYTPNIAFRHMVRVRGRVSLQWPGRSLCIQDGNQGLCVQTAQMTPVALGASVDVVGFPSVGGFTPTLTDATFRSMGGRQVVNGSPVTAEEAVRGDYDAKLVQIYGKVIGRDRAAKDPTMVLASGRFLFPVVIPDQPGTPAWEEGSTLRVTGICSVRIEPTKDLQAGLSIPASFRILLRSPNDVVILKRPSWWTARHLLPLLTAVLAITLCLLGWAAILRHRIADQTATIQKQNATLRELSFQDTLTLVANRRKFDQTLEIEFGQAARSLTPVSLLMMDIDHFKALNDEYGHQRGDECLVRVATALVLASVRKTDLVARYGGEEFAVILPGCDEVEATAIAERMRTAVFDLGIANAKSPSNRSVSISVGAATIVPGFGAASASLIALADQALYQSKLLGRNRTTLSLVPG